MEEQPKKENYCEVSKEPATGYRCSSFLFKCAKTERNAGIGSFPNTCVSQTWGASHKIGVGSVPQGEAFLSIYALQVALN